jgi:hypothetical protein
MFQAFFFLVSGTSRKAYPGVGLSPVYLSHTVRTLHDIVIHPSYDKHKSFNILTLSSAASRPARDAHSPQATLHHPRIHICLGSMSEPRTLPCRCLAFRYRSSYRTFDCASRRCDDPCAYAVDEATYRTSRVP